MSWRDHRYPAPLPPLRRQQQEDRCETRYLLALIAAYLVAIAVLLPLLLMGKL